jgi:hypothetical protein
MAYGHAERNLAAIRKLEAETRQLLGTMTQLDQEQSAWLGEAAGPGDKGPDLPSGSARLYQPARSARSGWFAASLFAQNRPSGRTLRAFFAHARLGTCEGPGARAAGQAKARQPRAACEGGAA